MKQTVGFLWSIAHIEKLHVFNLYCSQGGKTGAVQKCGTCRGRGMRIMIRQLAPGMVQQMQTVCSDCNGEGKCGVTCLSTS